MAPAEGKSGDTLIVGPSWVGDMVMAQSLFKTLKEQSPSAAIDVVAPAWSAPLLARMPEVRSAHALAAGHGQLLLGARRALGHSLRPLRFARAIVLPRSFKAALVPFFAAIPERIGYRGEWRYGVLTERRTLDKQRLPTTVSRYVALGLDASQTPLAVPFPALDHDETNAAQLLGKLDLATDSRVIALLPGAEYGPAKQWPAEYYAELAARLRERGNEVWILGSKKERELGDTITGDSGARNLCGLTTLTDAIDLLHLADLAVSNDSGLMHVAAACGCRVVALYGSSSAAFTPPLTDAATIVSEPQPCSPCFARTCRFGHYRCLREIRVERVVQALQDGCRS